ncbi:Holliday junction resolvase RuvX [Candidatus Saccharibacteria bacterium]|nr:Holliday junction resolvase RuvX [Candidatus Saccharibacteria bacterium]
MDRNNVMALDVGARRIGVAVASTLSRLASPVEFIDLKKTPEAVYEIKKLIEKHKISTVVVGLPRGLDGQETAQTSTSRQFATYLSKNVSQPVVMQDEAGTSKEAVALLELRRKPYSKGDIDSEAAALILRDWLENSLERTA